jgi:nucleoside-diphosphate-sugar epimerase
VRREDAFSIIKTGPSVQQYLNRLESAVVPDNAVEGAYDDALAGAKYVVHIAGAWPMAVGSYQCRFNVHQPLTNQYLHPDNEIYYPFIKSTKNIIQAAGKSGTVKRVVFTEAGAGLIDSEVGDTYGNQMKEVLNEHVEVNQRALTYRPPLKSPHQAYCAAKSQCMTLLNDLRLKKELAFSIAQIIPGTVMGPSEFVTTRTDALNHIDRQTKALLFDDMAPRYAFGFVHVQDCARIHIEALDEEKVQNEDVPPWYVAAATSEEGLNGEKTWNKAADKVEKEFAEEIENGTFKLGRSKTPLNMPYRVDSQQTEKTLLEGDKIRGLEECVNEVAQWYLSLKAE